MTTLYGIPNCNTVKKARQWLLDAGVDHTFHDFKKLGAPADRLAAWTDELGLAKLVNRQGTTWRGLSDEDKARAEARESAIALMQDKTSVIKRPVLEHDGKILAGFSEAAYAEAFQR
ncbi:arsenate reductase [Crenobacter cavernae]|uniref:Arsenate reductase n=1 Tax=Crenobacter cavernae TaxID=2290923 RepID=A0ABY0FAQ1_9NEIS|nr:arsenate reductase [Crenobacter cavernae]RXZ42535.1 arsenate reductase [Crenobacter cavernae]